jgi:uncharacterized protein YbbC (DUF1343 family)
MKRHLVLILFLVVLGLTACDRSASQAQQSLDPSVQVKTGAEVLAERNFDLLIDKHVGLITNNTAVIDSVHLIDVILQNPEINLVALFGPEHGPRGIEEAGHLVDDMRHEATGIPVYSLYGQDRKPDPEVLAKLDLLIFDIQDIGARFYTYISTMGLAMQAATEAGIPFVVLDRPNWIGGTGMAGFIREPEFESFVGQYAVPITHGLTIGELAELIKGEALLPGLETLDLIVVPMQNWSRDQHWPTTNLPWIPTSPNIPDYETALVYPGTCLIEGTTISEGRGTREPFKLVGAPWAGASALADTLNARRLPGVRFESASFIPKSIPGMSSSPKLEGQPLNGIRQIVTDPAVYRPVETGIHILHAFYQSAPDPTGFFRPRWLDTLAGTERLRRMLMQGASPETIIASWQDEVDAFARQRALYVLY